MGFMKVVLAGGSGALGRRIAADLTERGDEVVILTRSERPTSPYRQVVWDGATVGPWRDELSGAALVNLAGELVDCRPTAANIELLTRSRVVPTRTLARAAEGLREPVTTWVQLATLAIYGDAGEPVLDETAAPADGPPQMAGVARAWEAAAADVPADRQVLLRTAVVLDRDTPALDRLVSVVRWGIGGRIASGRQWVSWLHISDLLGIVRATLDDPGLSGTLHATSPHPVRNAELMAGLRHVLHRPAAPPTPAWLLRVGAVVLGTDPALALTGRRCVPRRLQAHGFEFRFPELRPALEDLLSG
jgi:uncharacterized protein